MLERWMKTALIVFFFIDLVTAIEIQRNLRKLADNTPLLQIKCKGWDGQSLLQLAFQPSLLIGKHYEMINKDPYDLAARFRPHKSNDTKTIFLRLIKGQSWAESAKNSSSNNIPLFVTISYPLQKGISENYVQIATVIKGRRLCPKITNLPGASKHLMNYLKKTLSSCDGMRIYRSKKLSKYSFSSLSLLYMEPALFLIDGSDQNFLDAAISVDNFLAKHSVLEVAWEPMNVMGSAGNGGSAGGGASNEPLWWVLIPRPKGHLFAMLDALQWEHPLVAEAVHNNNKNKNNKIIPYKNTNCKKGRDGKMYCTPGCENTAIKSITASGYNADTHHLVDKLRQALYADIPFQAAPVRLGVRAMAPIWDHTLGWSYTFGACSSNFLDCFFLDHSPCPKIDIDVNNPPVADSVDKKRFIQMNNMEDAPLWYKDGV
eukprot:gene7678-15722_t